MSDIAIAMTILGSVVIAFVTIRILAVILIAALFVVSESLDSSSSRQFGRSSQPTD